MPIRRASRSAKWDDPTLIACLQAAAAARSPATSDEPLGIPDYDAWAAAQQGPVPTAATIRHRFDNWGNACAAAGVTGRRPGGSRVETDTEVLAEALRLRGDVGLTFEEVGHALGCNAQTAWRIITAAPGGDPLDGADATERFALRNGARVVELFGRLRDPKAVAAELDLSERLVVRHLRHAGIAHLALPSGSDEAVIRGWREKDLTVLLRRAAAADGEPLTMAGFERWALRTGTRVPAMRTFLVRFDRWVDACAAAGVRAGESLHDDYQRVEADECLAAVAAYVAECAAGGRRPTMTGYELISAERGWPCRNTVLHRLRCPWREAVRRVTGVADSGVLSA